MQLTTLLTTLFAATALAAPAPAPEAAPIAEADAPILEARAQDLIDLWKNKNFLDLKFTGSANPGDCKNLPSNFNDISSSGKAKAGFRCTIWVDKDCKGTGFSFNQNPGSSAFPDWINDKASSWKCVKA